MKKNEKNSTPDRFDDPSLQALWMLRSTKENPHPRYAWDFNTVMPSDLVIKEK